MRTNNILLFSLLLFLLAAASSSNATTGMDGQYITVDYLRSSAKDALNTTPHISRGVKVKRTKESKDSKEAKRDGTKPRLNSSLVE